MDANYFAILPATRRHSRVFTQKCSAQKPTVTVRQWWYYRGGKRQDNTGLQVAVEEAEETAADRQTTCVRRHTRPPSLLPSEEYDLATLGNLSPAFVSINTIPYTTHYKTPFTFISPCKEWPQLSDHRTKLDPQPPTQESICDTSSYSLLW